MLYIKRLIFEILYHSTMTDFFIPTQEPFFNENETGSVERPWLFRVTHGQFLGRSIIFHVKIGNEYFEYWLFRQFKSNKSISSTRCSKNTHGCKHTGRIQFKKIRNRLSILRKILQK